MQESMEKEQKFSLETKRSSFATRKTQEGRDVVVVPSQNGREICDCKVNNAKETNKSKSRVWKTVMWFTRKGKSVKMDCCQCDGMGSGYSRRDLRESTEQAEPSVHSNSWSFTRTASRKFRISSRKRRCKSESSKKPFCGHREHALPSGCKPKSGAHGSVRCGAGDPTATGSFCDFGSNGRIGSGAARKTKQTSFLTEIARELNPPAGNHPLKEVNNCRPSSDLSKSLSSNFSGCTAESLIPLLNQSVRRCKSFPGPFSNTCSFKRRNIDQQNGDAGYFSPPSKQKCHGHRRTATFGGKPSAEFMSTRVRKSKSANTADFMKLEKMSSSLGEIRDQDGSIVGIVHFYKSPKSSCMRRLSSFSDGIRPRKLSEGISGSVNSVENRESTSSENEGKMDSYYFDGTLDSTISFPKCFPSSQDPINRGVTGITSSSLPESHLETNLNLSHGSRSMKELESEQPALALQNSQTPDVDSSISESYLDGNLSLSPVEELQQEQTLISLLNPQNAGVDGVNDTGFSESFMANGLKLSPIAKPTDLNFEPGITEQPEKCLNSTIPDISVVQEDALLDTVESIGTETEQKRATAVQDISETIEERDKSKTINSDVYALQKPLNDAFMNELADGYLQTSDGKNRNQITSKVHLDPVSEGYISLDNTFSHNISIDRYNRNENLNLEDGVILSSCNPSCTTAQSCPNGVKRLQDICENDTFKLHENSFTGGPSDDEMMSTDSSETDAIAQIQQQEGSDELGHSSSKQSCVGNRIMHEEGLTSEVSIRDFSTGTEGGDGYNHESMCFPEASEKLETVWEQAALHEEVVEKGMEKAQKFSMKAKSSTSHRLQEERQVMVNSLRCHKCDYRFTKETNKMKSCITCTYPCKEVVKKSVPFGSSDVAPVDGEKDSKSIAQVLENSSSSDYASCSDEELPNLGDNPLNIWKTAEQTGLKEEDLRLPVPGETFKMRTELILRWFEEFNDEQKNIVMKKLLNRCQLPQMHLLSVAMEPNLHKSCPPNCQDMLVWLPYLVTLKILMYLDPVSLCQCNQVNKAWNELTNNPLLWQQLTRSTDYQLSEASSRKQYLKYTLSNGNIHWKKVLAEKYLLQRNWLNGKYTLRTYEGHHQGIACVQFDDTRIVSGSSDKTIKLWDISNTNSELMLTLEGHSGTVRCLDLNGNRLVSGSTDCTIKVWDLSFASYWAGASCKVTMVGHLHTVRCLQADDKKLVSGSYDKTVKVWDLKTGECGLTLRGHTAAVLCVQFDDQKIVSGSYDKKIKVWHLTEGTCLMTLDGHQDAVTCLNLTHDGMKIITGSLDYSLKFWDLLTGKCYGTLDWITSEGHTAVVRCLQVDSWRIISGGDDKTLKVWELATGQRLLTLRYHSDGVTCMQFNDFAIVSGSYDRTVKLWDFTPHHPYLEMV